MTVATPLLEVKDLAVAFQGYQFCPEAVTRASFSVNPGELLALVGESGSGKSITAHAIMGLLPPGGRVIRGSLTFRGQNLLTKTESEIRSLRGGAIGMIFQEPMMALNPLHSIGKQIAESILVHQPLNRSEARERVKELLSQVGLEKFHQRLDAYPYQLSGGERQRVMIAMAIANNPELLIADEPTTALDVTVQAQILRLLKKLQEERKMAVLLITHDLTVVRRLADRVAVMRYGEVVETGQTDELFAHPRHSYTQTLLASEPKGSPEPVHSGTETILASNELSVRYPLKRNFWGKPKEWLIAAHQISLNLRRGETLAIVGESGSGKSTVAQALLRLIASEGEIRFRDSVLSGLSGQEVRPYRKALQIVFQDPYGSLNPRMSIEEIIAEGLKLHHPELSVTEVSARVETAMQEVGLEASLKYRYPHEFSGGQRQRINIARAVALKPDCMVLDEPTSALDLSLQSQIIELLKALQRKYGMAYLFISHDLRVVKALSHRVVVMKDGKIVEQADTETLFQTPQTDYTRNLLKAAMLDF
jgi:ABC-type microcin C transport system duplicated ATPase subunit YejF